MEKWHIGDGWIILVKLNGRWEVLRQWDMRSGCYPRRREACDKTTAGLRPTECCASLEDDMTALEYLKAAQQDLSELDEWLPNDILADPTRRRLSRARGNICAAIVLLEDEPKPTRKDKT